MANPKLAALERKLDLNFQNATGEQRRRTLATVAKQGLQDELNKQRARAGVEPVYQTRVDGVVGASPDSVKVGGEIRFDFEYVQEVANYTAALLKEMSPVLTGHYRDSHAMFVNGNEVKDLSGLKPNDEITFMNYQPYARKIEKGESIKAPNGVYEIAAKMAKRRYGNVAVVEFTWRGLIGGTAVNPTTSSRGSKAHNKSDVRYPCINMKARG